MSLRIIVDMNLPRGWIAFLETAGWVCQHWSEVGDPHAKDTTIMAWALAEGFIVFTHDLDFGTALALTHAQGPSVIQVRSQQVFPEDIGTMVLLALDQFEHELAAGALVVVEPRRSRVRILPL